MQHYLTGQNPLELLQRVGTETAPKESPRAAPTGYDRERDFVAAVLGDTEDTWGRIFQAQGQTYREPMVARHLGAASPLAAARLEKGQVRGGDTFGQNPL